MGEKTGSAAETRVSLPPREVLPRMAYTGRPVADSGEGPGPPFFLGADHLTLEGGGG